MRFGWPKVKQFCIQYRKIILFCAIAAFVLPEVTVYFHRGGRGADIGGYIRAGDDALHLRNLYRHSAPGKNNTWPPFFSFFAIPLALSKQWLGLPITKELWYFFNFFCLIALMKIWASFLQGSAPKLVSDKKPDFTSPIMFVPFFALLSPFVKNYFMLQINVFILFILTLCIYFHRKGKGIPAGICIGFAASLKALPGFFVIYFALRKQWKVVAAAVVSGIAFTLMPLLFYGVEGYISLITTWLDISLNQPLVVGYDTHSNQSIYAFWERLLAHQLNLVSVENKVIGTAAKFSGLAVMITTMVFFLRKPYDRHSYRALIEFSAGIIIMMLLSPIAWGHYWVLLYPAAFLTLSLPLMFSYKPPNKAFWYLTGIWIGLIEIPYLTGMMGERFFKKFSVFTLSALLLLVLLVIVHRYVLPEIPLVREKEK
ncbi:MAG: DUF2029 domain-containing protein [Chitinivibrionales bacterium]|nr:DUF2029 domain-containing protein [Chitinivibrionales bacterium]